MILMSATAFGSFKRHKCAFDCEFGGNSNWCQYLPFAMHRNLNKYDLRITMIKDVFNLF